MYLYPDAVIGAQPTNQLLVVALMGHFPVHKGVPKSNPPRPDEGVTGYHLLQRVGTPHPYDGLMA